jgi:membrane peptidoglycan carboxypeptidase
MLRLVKIIFTLVLLVAIAGTALLWVGWSEINKKASSFDLSEVRKMEAASTVLDRNGRQIGQIKMINRRPVTLASMSRWVPAAAIATEDTRFYKHSGVDPVGVFRAVLHNLKAGGIRQGASTITQQLARDSFGIRERTYQRKLLEAALAVRLESELSKQEILETYLNRIYFGAGLYGVESAGMGYFGKPASKLNPSEAAMLASLIRSPNAMSPWKNPDRAERGRRVVLGQMLEQKMLTQAEHDEWVSKPPQVIPRKPAKGDSYVVESVRIALGDILPSSLVLGGGLTIRTTIDSSLQSAAELAVREHAEMVESRPEMDGVQTLAEFHKKSEDLGKTASPPSTPAPPKYLQASLVAVENSTGGILAIVGGRSFQHSEYNRVTLSRRPPAGIFSPFVALAALDSGLSAGAVFEDWPLDNKFVGIGGAEGVLGEWGVESPTNSYERQMPMRAILLKGKNAALARLGFSVGLDKLGEVTRAAGFKVPKKLAASSYVEGIPSSPLELALAYTCFPRGGTRPASAFLISEVVAPSGEAIYSATLGDVEVCKPESAWIVDDILRQGLLSGPSSKVREYAPLLANIAARSGTSYGFEDAWFAGYDQRMSLVAWMGFDKPGQIFRGAFGSEIAAPLWAQVMKKSPHSMSPRPLPDSLQKYDLCPITGELRTPQCPTNTATVNLSEYVSKPGPSPCSEHSGILVLPKAQEQSPWPRAEQLVDTRTVRPVNVERGYIPHSMDPYESLAPSTGSLAAIRVEAAQPAQLPPPSASGLPGSTPLPEPTETNATNPAPTPSPPTGSSPTPAPPPRPPVLGQALGGTTPTSPPNAE